jgi:hypothetical protein
LEDSSSEEEEHQWEEKWEEEEEVLEEVAHLPIKNKSSKTKNYHQKKSPRSRCIFVDDEAEEVDDCRKATLITQKKPVMTTRRTRRTKMDWN